MTRSLLDGVAGEIGEIVPGGFEPPSMAPKAIMIGHYTTGLLARRIRTQT